MDLEKEILEKQSLANKKRIVNWIGGHEERFAQLVNLFFREEYRLTQHAAWPLSYCIQQHPRLARPYIKKFIERLSMDHGHPALKRNILRLLQFVDIPKASQGRIMNLCFRFIADPAEAIAVKAFSLHILEIMSDSYPEILPEIKVIIKSRWDFESPAFRSRARKILKKT